MTLPVAAAPPRAAGIAPTTREHRFFLGAAILVALVVFVGFAPTFYLRGAFHHPDPLPRVFQVHGAVFSAWVILFVLQTALVSMRRTALHRRLGWVGGVVAALMLVTGFLAAAAAVRRGVSPPGLPPPLIFFAVPFFDLVTFAALVGAGLSQRAKPAYHKRLMLLATLSVLTAAVARLPGVAPLGILGFFALTDVWLLAGIVHDRMTRGRVHPAFAWGGLFLVVSQVGRLAIASTAPWQAIARWVTGA
jgi:hypothetical protein